VILTFFSRVMFTSRGNIRRKRKAPREAPKPNSDRMVMKKLRDDRIRLERAGPANGEQNDEDNNDYAGDELETHVGPWQRDYDNHDGEGGRSGDDLDDDNNDDNNNDNNNDNEDDNNDFH
jgi:hypothetical protein